jgi:hypothetical protein
MNKNMNELSLQAHDEKKRNELANLENIKLRRYRKSDKLYLQQMLTEEMEEELDNKNPNDYNDGITETKHNEHRNKCKLVVKEITLKVENCNRITLNTTMCEGYCKSSEILIPATNLKIRKCSACKAHKYKIEKHSVTCLNGNIKYFKLKSVAACDCFRHEHKILNI